MKTHITTVIIALVMGYLGGYLNHNNQTVINTNTQQSPGNNNFQAQTNSDDLIYLVDTLQYKIEDLQKQLNTLEKNQSP